MSRQALDVQQGLEFLAVNGGQQAAEAIGGLMGQHPVAVEALLSGVADVVEIGGSGVGLTEDI